jgi:hypothetical protein
LSIAVIGKFETVMTLSFMYKPTNTHFMMFSYISILSFILNMYMFQSLL